eukprot:3895661-Amphidinium_carterae.1
MFQAKPKGVRNHKTSKFVFKWYDIRLTAEFLVGAKYVRIVVVVMACCESSHRLSVPTKVGAGRLRSKGTPP